MKTVVKLMVVLVTSRPPDHPRVYPLICARVENERVSRRPNDEANGARRDGARSARRSAAAAAAAGKKRRARKTKNPNVVHLAFAPAAASKPQTADLARMFRAKRGHECPYARRGDEVHPRDRGFPRRAPRSHPMKSRILGSRKSADRARKVSGGREEKTGAGSNARESARLARAAAGPPSRRARWKKKSFCGLVCAQAQPTHKQPRVLSSSHEEAPRPERRGRTEERFPREPKKKQKKFSSRVSAPFPSRAAPGLGRRPRPATNQYERKRSLCGPQNADATDR